jgi:ribosome-associated toxin RatA of RatAB toxin-antitoxin module
MASHWSSAAAVAATCLAAFATRASAAPGEALSFAADGLRQCAERRDELRAGRVVYIEQKPAGGEGVALTACGLVDAPPAEVWPVLRDCEEYEHFLPGVEHSALKSREGNVALCEALIDLPFPLGDLRSVERAVESELAGGGFERRWSLEHGTYRRLEGSWTLLPWVDDARRTLAVYQLDMDPESVVPDFLLRRAQSATAPGVFSAIRERVRRCGGSSPEGSCGAK